jgi:glutathione synthase/RimK-type ligase-like ATP-grasp enzyme
LEDLHYKKGDRKVIIAIQPEPTIGWEKSSELWAHFVEEAGHHVRFVDSRRPDILNQLEGCQGFMWRIYYHPATKQIARRLLPVIEHELGIPVWPDHNTGWHYDDKVAQSYLFQANDIPTPETWIWYDYQLALEWAERTDYPKVLKLRSGSGSKNVRLIESCTEAKRWIDSLFLNGVYNLKQRSLTPMPLGRRRLRDGLKLLLLGARPQVPLRWWELHKGYAYFEQFLPGNSYDTRITVIGNRAFGFRRWNRDDGFRASGSGKLSYSLEGVDPAFIELAFQVADKLGMKSCAIDGLWRGEDPVVVEVSYTYLSSAIYECPGHWDKNLNWHEGNMYPEEAHVQDFLQILEKRCESH